MNPISSDIVEKIWKKTGEISPEKGPEMIKRMSKQQPLILAYLMSTGNDVLSQEERELLLYLGVIVWQIMFQGTTQLPKVTEKVLDEIEDSNMKMLEYLKDESEGGFIDTVEKIINNYNQREVLRYVVEAIMEEPEEGSMI